LLEELPDLMGSGSSEGEEFLHDISTVTGLAKKVCTILLFKIFWGVHPLPSAKKNQAMGRARAPPKKKKAQRQ
jgi:hypothetical protein